MSARESRVRRLARSMGFSLTKSRSRTPESLEFGGYMISDPFMNAVVVGGHPWAFSLDLDEAEAWLNSPD